MINQIPSKSNNFVSSFVYCLLYTYHKNFNESLMLLTWFKYLVVNGEWYSVIDCKNAKNKTLTLLHYLLLTNEFLPHVAFFVSESSPWDLVRGWKSCQALICQIPGIIPQCWLRIQPDAIKHLCPISTRLHHRIDQSMITILQPSR